VLADGTMVEALNHLRKNNTGLDLKQLFVGTSGIFGVITGAVLQVVPAPNSMRRPWWAVPPGRTVLALLQTLERELADVFTAFEVISADALIPVFRHHTDIRNPYGSGQVPAYTALVELSSTLPGAALNLPEVLEERLGAFLEGDGARTSRTSSWASRGFLVYPAPHQRKPAKRGQGAGLRHQRAQEPHGPPSRRPPAPFSRPSIPSCAAAISAHWGDGGTHLNLVWDESNSPVTTAEAGARTSDPHLRSRRDGLRRKLQRRAWRRTHNQRFYEGLYPEPIRRLNGAIKAHLDPGRILGTTRLD